MCFFFQIIYPRTQYESVKVKGLEWRKFISTTQSTRLGFIDLKYNDHKIYGYRVQTFHLLVTERTPMTEQTQRDLLEAKEEETFKR